MKSSHALTEPIPRPGSQTLSRCAIARTLRADPIPSSAAPVCIFHSRQRRPSGPQFQTANMSLPPRLLLPFGTTRMHLRHHRSHSPLRLSPFAQRRSGPRRAALLVLRKHGEGAAAPVTPRTDRRQGGFRQADVAISSRHTCRPPAGTELWAMFRPGICGFQGGKAVGRSLHVANQAVGARRGKGPLQLSGAHCRRSLQALRRSWSERGRAGWRRARWPWRGWLGAGRQRA
jgi:hypothetical protein